MQSARRLTTLAALLALWLLLAASAQATVVTVGSPLTATFVSGLYGGSNTLVNTGMPEPGANVASPVSGTIIGWKAALAIGTFKLHVVRQSGGLFTSAGTSSSQTLVGATVSPLLPTNLPIQTGDLIGLDNSAGGERIGQTTDPRSTYIAFTPPLADGAPARSPSLIGSSAEYAFNALVAVMPSNAFSFGKVKHKTHNGTAKLAVNVPGPGTLSLAGKGVKTQRAGDRAVASKTVTAAGTVKLLIKAKGKTKAKLNKKGKVKAKVTVTYTPVAEVSGVPNTQAKRVKLVKKG